MKIGDLFQRDIARRVNPVVKVEDHDEGEVKAELAEYVVTPQIGKHFVRLIEQHYLLPSTPDTAIWISGFFGSGKSLFLKLLCLLLAHDSVGGVSVIEQLSNAADDADVKRALRALKSRPKALVISTHMESEAFTGASIVEMLWRQLHAACGYSKIPWIAEMERSLEKGGLLGAFAAAIEADRGLAWTEVREDPLLRRPLLAKALVAVDAHTYRDVASAERAIEETQQAIKQEQTAAGFTRRCLDLLEERKEYGRLFWGLDEMGQYAADRSELLLELQSIVEQFSMHGKGKLWIAATAQQRLDDVVDNYAGKSDQVAKIRDRFPKALRVELSQDDAERVVRQRLLNKSSTERASLLAFLLPHESWILTELTIQGERLPYKPPVLEEVVDCYPFLPAQFQLITEFMQGLSRDTGGTADRTARGPRALIAVTQDIARSLKDDDVGTIASVDSIYEEMQASIAPEDIDVVKDLRRLDDAPELSDRILKASYVMEEIGDNILATQENIRRSLVNTIGSTVAPSEVANSITFLTEKTFIREVGSAGALTYRFLKAYQRKIEDDVRNQSITIQEQRTKTIELVRKALKPLMPSARISFRGVRTFSLGVVVNKEFSPNDYDIRVNVFSPDERHSPDDDSRAESTTEHSVYWLPAELGGFDREVALIVATSKVLIHRIARASTEDERSQLNRASEDLQHREDRIVLKLVAALKSGVLYVEGREVPPSAQPADAIIERLVELRYQGLWRAAVRVEEKDLEQVFQKQKPATGPLVDLGLLVKGQFTESSELAQAVLGAVKVLTFKGGATGDRIIDELRNAPRGYGDMQTRLAVSSLCAQGLLRAHAAGGAVVTRDGDLPQRLRATNEFKRLTFELEESADPIELKAVSDLLEQRFDQKLPPEPPLLAQSIRAACVELRRQMAELEGRVRGDVPQVAPRLAPLKTATTAVIGAHGDSATIHEAADKSVVLDGWKQVFSPLNSMLDADAVSAVVDARKLVASQAARSLAAEDADRLTKLLDGDQPWQDLKQIRQLSAAIGGRIKAELGDLHEQLDNVAAAAIQRIEARAAEIGASADLVADAKRRVTQLRCLRFAPRDDGTCGTCGSDVETMRMRLIVWATREEEIVGDLLENAKPPPDEGPPAPPRVKVSIHAALQTPREVNDLAQLETLVADFRSHIESAIKANGGIIIVS